MKKFLLVTIFIFCSIILFGQKVSYGDYFKTYNLKFDTTCYFGSSFSGKNIFSFDFSVKGVMLGMGCIYDTERCSYHKIKDVKVSSYTKKDGTDVKGHYRSRPNSTGTSTKYNLTFGEVYLGYWFPSISFGKSVVYASPILGIGNYEKYGEFLFGSALKVAFNEQNFKNFGMTFKATNRSISFGLSFNIL